MEQTAKRGWRLKTSDRLAALVPSFADTRNSIIHEGAELTGGYEVTGSAYEGPWIHTGERLLRESIKVWLRSFGHPTA